MRIAVIAIGSNSIRSLTATLAAPLGSPVRGRQETRLFLALNEQMRFDQAAIKRLVDAVFLLKQQALENGARHVHLMATCAVRDSGNTRELARALKQETGLHLRILTGQQEAALSFLGAAYPYDEGEQIGVIDIGGGSTEIALGSVARLQTAHSLQLGASRLHRISPVTDLLHMEAALAHARQMVQQQLTNLHARADARWLLVGGTGTALMGLIKGRLLPTGSPDEAFTIHEALAVLHQLTALSPEERSALPGMMPGREHILPTGLCILIALMEQLDIPMAHVTTRNNTDGFLFELYRERERGHG